MGTAVLVCRLEENLPGTLAAAAAAAVVAVAAAAAAEASAAAADFRPRSWPETAPYGPGRATADLRTTADGRGGRSASYCRNGPAIPQ